MYSKYGLDGVNWDFEAIIRIKQLGISCDKVRGGEDEGGRGSTQGEWERKERNIRGDEILDDAGEENLTRMMTNTQNMQKFELGEKIFFFSFEFQFTLFTQCQMTTKAISRLFRL